MIIVLISSNASPTPPAADGWTRLGCACPDICANSGSGSGSGGGETVCKGVTIPATITATFSGWDEEYTDPPDLGSTAYTFPVPIVSGLAYIPPPFENVAYTLERFTPVTESLPECVYCFRLGTMTQTEIATLYGLAAEPGSVSDLPQYVYVGMTNDGVEDVYAYLAIHICVDFNPDSPTYLGFCQRIAGLYVRPPVPTAIPPIPGDIRYVNFNYFGPFYDVTGAGDWGGPLSAGMGSVEWGISQDEVPCLSTGFPYPEGPFTGTPPVLTYTNDGTPPSGDITWTAP